LKWTDNFLRISPGNEALQYIDRRLKSDGYRGAHRSQHNRYVMSDVVDVMRLLSRHMPKSGMLPIRTTDISKRPLLRAEEEGYARFCDDVRKKIRKGSQDAMRKNYFPDFHRMGLIERYDKDGNPTDPYSQKQRVKYVGMTETGRRLPSMDEMDAYFAYSKCIDRLLGGQIETVFRILRDKELDWLDLHEYMFFVSGIGAGGAFSISVSGATDLIKEYRSLTPVQRRLLHETLRKDLEPSMSAPHKPDRRDLHNWLNEAQQVFSLLTQTVYFDVSGGRLALTAAKTATGLARMLRSKSQMKNYFQNHLIEKKPGFELHHVVPLAWSESQSHFKILDDWKNMLYIDGFSHAKVTQNRNANVIMDAKGHDIILRDLASHEVYLENEKNTLYDVSKQKLMLQHNKKILRSYRHGQDPATGGGSDAA